MSDAHRIQHIDAWRFIAVSMVFIAHLVTSLNERLSIEILPAILRHGAFGHLGVLIFFFISGFVICRGLIAEQAEFSTISLKAFYVRRSFRIIPPLYLYLAVIVFVAYMDWAGIGYRQIIKSALFLCNMDFRGGGCGWVAGHTWSLAYEEQFYLLFPLLFIALGLVAQPRILLILLLIMAGATLGIRAYGSNWIAGYLNYMIFLLTGCAAALYWRRLSHWSRKISVINWMIAFTSLIAFVVFLPVSTEVNVMTVIYPPLIGLLVLGTPVAHPMVRKLFHHPVIAYLGRISYTVYLWQQLATCPFPAISPWWTILFSIAVWPFAHFSYKYLVLPLIGFAHRWSEDIKQRNLAKRTHIIKST